MQEMRMQMPPQPTTQAAKLWARKFSLFGKKAINIIYNTVSIQMGKEEDWRAEMSILFKKKNCLWKLQKKLLVRQPKPLPREGCLYALS